jgi:alpha-methylacyl-CoA racemase
MSEGTGTAPGGPLAGVRVIEIASIGPGPFGCMLLADMGADVIRVSRPQPATSPSFQRSDLTNRGKRSIVLDLKHDAGLRVARDLIRAADVLVEGFRPGVMERLGLGPEESLHDNPRLVYGRMTGWGQSGPLAQRAGHDINYISLTGALWASGRREERPVPALNLVGDYGGGAMFLVFGIVSALYERERSNRGQVVDAAMVDGVAALTTSHHALRHGGLWADQRGRNLLDSGAAFYEVYECADGKFVSVGAIEPEFYAELVRLTGFRAGRTDAERFARGSGDEEKLEWAALFKTRTRDEWAALAFSADACLAPVLDWAEAPAHPQLRARGTFIEPGGVTQPAPAPRFSRSRAEVRARPPVNGEHANEILAEAGLADDAIGALRAIGAIGD